MQFSEVIIILIPITNILAAPIDEEGHRTLRNIMKFIENQISKSVKWKVQNCNENSEFPDETEPMEMLKNLRKKLKNPQENLEKPEVDQVLDGVMEYAEKAEQTMAKKVKSLPTYNSERRFEEAVRVEKTFENSSLVQLGTSNEIESVQNYLDMAKLENIRAKFEMANILAKLTSPKKQQEYANHFLMYFYTKEDLEKDLANAERHLARMPPCCESSIKLCDAMGTVDLLGTENLCCCCCFYTAETLMLAGFAVTIPFDLACCIRRGCVERKKEKIRQKLAKIEKEKAESERKIATEN